MAYYLFFYRIKFNNNSVIFRKSLICTVKHMKNLRYKMQKSYIITVVHILLLEKSIKGEVHMESLKERLLQEQYRLEQILKKTQEQLKNAP